MPLLLSTLSLGTLWVYSCWGSSFWGVLVRSDGNLSYNHPFGYVCFFWAFIHIDSQSYGWKWILKPVCHHSLGFTIWYFLLRSSDPRSRQWRSRHIFFISMFLRVLLTLLLCYLFIRISFNVFFITIFCLKLFSLLGIRLLILFTQPLRSGRIWHKVNFKAEFNRFEFRVFLLLD